MDWSKIIKQSKTKLGDISSDFGSEQTVEISGLLLGVLVWAKVGWDELTGVTDPDHVVKEAEGEQTSERNRVEVFFGSGGILTELTW